MALAETAQLAVRLSLDDRLSPAIRKTQGALHTLGSTAKTVGKGIAVGLGAAAAVGVVALTSALRSGIAALKADAVVAAQTRAVLKSTGGVAGVTADAVERLADELSTLNGVQDDVVQGAENVILRFTSIGKDIFPAVTQAALDMAAATGTDAASAALKLSRAIDNPLKGLTALTRAGIVFSDQEKAQITDLIKHNKLRDAQAIVLTKVKQKFDGVAKAQADADPSRRLQVGIEKFQKALASGLLPVIEKIQVRLTQWITKPETLATIRKVGDAIASIFTDENLDTAASAISTAANAVKTAITAFNSLPSEVKALAIGAFAINKVTGGAVTGIASTFGKILGAGLSKIFAANVTVISPNVIGGGGGIGGALPGIGGAAAGGAGIGLGTVAVAAIAAVAVPLVINEIEKDPDLRVSGARSRFGTTRQAVTGSPVTDAITANKVFGGIGFKISDAISIGLSKPINELARALNSSQLTAYLKDLRSRVGGLRQERRERREAGDREGAKLISIRLQSIARREELTKRAIDELRTSTNPRLTAIRSHIDIERNRLASLQQRLHVAKENHDSARAHALRGKIQEVRSNISRSNVKLQQIVNKDWTPTIAITNQISINDFNDTSHVHNTVAPRSSLRSRP